MTKEVDAMDFVGEMSQATGVSLAIGVNVYSEDPDPFSSCMVLVDPSSLNDEDVSKLFEYSERKGFRVVETWSDWGRFLKIMKLRHAFVSAFSP